MMRSQICLISLKGGTTHNAIPRDAAATFACDPSQAATVTKMVGDFQKTLQTEYAATEPLMAISLFPLDSGPKDNMALSRQETRKVIDLILSLPHGVMGMSPDFDGLGDSPITITVLTQVGIFQGRLDSDAPRIRIL